MAKLASKGKRNAMKRQVPGGVPGIFPFVRHGDDIFVVEVWPIVITTIEPFLRWRRIVQVSLKPTLYDIVIVLLRPEQPGEALAHDILRIR